MEWPALADIAPDAFPKDVVGRAKELAAEIGSVGAYSHSQGVPYIRQSVAKFIEGASPRFLDFHSDETNTQFSFRTGRLSR
jgi:aspartate/methionine/tyrosine aminotransferase